MSKSRFSFTSLRLIWYVKTHLNTTDIFLLKLQKETQNEGNPRWFKEEAGGEKKATSVPLSILEEKKRKMCADFHESSCKRESTNIWEEEWVSLYRQDDALNKHVWYECTWFGPDTNVPIPWSQEEWQRINHLQKRVAATIIYIHRCTYNIINIIYIYNNVCAHAYTIDTHTYTHTRVYYITCTHTCIHVCKNEIYVCVHSHMRSDFFWNDNRYWASNVHVCGKVAWYLLTRGVTYSFLFWKHPKYICIYILIPHPQLFDLHLWQLNDRRTANAMWLLCKYQ